MKYQIDDSYIDDIPSAVMYRRTMEHCPKSTIGCFITSDDWNEQTLLELKEGSEAWFLVGLQTDNIDFERLDIIEGVIRCQPDEVNDVIKLLNVNSASTIIGIDVVDIKSMFECDNLFQFIQASATGESDSDLVKIATQQLVSQLIKARHTKGLFIGMESVESPSLEVFSYVSEAVEALLSDDVFIYYSSSITDEPDCFRLKAIYASA
ncbi:hypothetical protein [Psychrobacter sp. LV10R520-6]|uniref:hypothetical protein n=1 Tax=Psychrobacter sp. LV10R520-6 TaxID=1415574 RepID=UPI0024C9C4E7|nr:hypothetical protein [Psychrobacter sp. LV10R520-6]SNT69645.1 hypothetical protein SAMN04488491_0742 [Psychrobacter sp. LV10R520-6]